MQCLRHKHIVELVEVYVQNSQLLVAMLPVAEIDLGKHLQQVDSTQFGPRRDEARYQTVQQPNQRQARVYLTDFSISVIHPDGKTTGDSVTASPLTRLYTPLEKLLGGSRRGWKTNIFALGCVFLEISTAIIESLGAQSRFNHFRLERSGTRSYADNSSAIL
jgi:hypothetical protein